MCSFLPICVVARKKVNAKKKDAHFILVGLEVPAVDRLLPDLFRLVRSGYVFTCIRQNNAGWQIILVSHARTE